MDIQILPILNDNYCYLLHDSVTGQVGVVDPGDADPVLDVLDAQGWRLNVIFNTHHHGDHVAGNQALKDRFGCPVIGPEADRSRIGTLDTGVAGGDTVRFGSETGAVLSIPGHTRHHIAFHFPDSRALFCGDTLFSLGCGRLFEGTAADMWQSMRALMPLPGDTRVYCGHEYTQSNARFAVTVDPDNAALRARVDEIAAQRARGEPTIPTTLDQERHTNPFLRADEPGVQTALGMDGADPVAVFAALRQRKDSF